MTDLEGITVVPYDPVWPERFERERRLLGNVFHGCSPDIAHVGSTAVPGLGGKPIVDIMVGVRTLRHMEERILSMSRHGYEYVPEYEAELPERRYFRKGRPVQFHVHAVVRETEFWQTHLLFRDDLRRHRGHAATYFALKRRLATEHRDDRRAYLRGKARFIESAVETAGREAGS